MHAYWSAMRQETSIVFAIVGIRKSSALDGGGNLQQLLTAAAGEGSHDPFLCTWCGETGAGNRSGEQKPVRWRVLP